MEVHAHAHTARKKWTHYLWEFLMLFLAVFCGFLAENFREEQVEHHREKQYMYSMLQDLRVDITEIDSNLLLGLQVAIALDSVIYILNEEDPVKNVKRLYEKFPIAGRIVQAGFTDRTSSQLKSSGSLRLVRNADLSDSISSYWAKVVEDEKIASLMFEVQGKAGDIASQVFSMKYYGKRDPNNPLTKTMAVRYDAKLLDDNPKLIAQFVNRITPRLGILYNYLNNLRETKMMALHLIEFIKKEYHLQ